LAFINFDTINAEDEKDLFDYWKECSVPYPLEMGEPDGNTQEGVIYTLNSNDTRKNILPNIHSAGHIFKDIEKLKLNILSIIKDNAGVGRNMCETSIRIYRVLSMYKCLLSKKILTKAMTDEICYPDQISQRTFYKDIRIIKEIENDRLIYDKSLKGYVLKE